MCDSFVSWLKPTDYVLVIDEFWKSLRVLIKIKFVLSDFSLRVKLENDKVQILTGLDFLKKLIFWFYRRKVTQNELKELCGKFKRFYYWWYMVFPLRFTLNIMLCLDSRIEENITNFAFVRFISMIIKQEFRLLFWMAVVRFA